MRASPKKQRAKGKEKAAELPATPAPAPSAHHQPTADSAMTIIDQASMASLIADGYPPAPLLNGPNEGDPMYAVPTADLRRLNMLSLAFRSEPEQHDDIPIDPDLLSGSQVATRRRSSRIAGATN